MNKILAGLWLGAMLAVSTGCGFYATQEPAPPAAVVAPEDGTDKTEAADSVVGVPEAPAASADKVDAAVAEAAGKEAEPAAAPAVSEAPPPAPPMPARAAAQPPNLGGDGRSLDGLDNTATGYGFGNNVDGDNRPTSAQAQQAKYGHYDADFIGPKNNKVYLTFDEGYENGYTARILDTLKAKGTPAVFFVTMPYVKGDPALVRRMIDEGHVVGAHSVTHPPAGMPSLSIAAQTKEMVDLHQYVKDHFGYEMYLFRYPAGIYSEQSLSLIQSLGYRSVFWSFAYKDWDPQNQPEQSDALTRLNNKMHPGAIYLLHAVSQTNTAILGQFIDDTRSKGYEFASYPQSF